MRRRGACLAVLAALALPASAGAFDTGPHTDLTHDALSGEGFGARAADIASVDNWLVDFYSQAATNPFSGHDTSAGQLLAALAVFPEHWPQLAIDAATTMHFDSTKTFDPNAEPKDLTTTAGEEQEWYRLQRNTTDALAAGRATHDPLALLTLIGISLHAVQDFYAHTNWTESNVLGQLGPGWSAHGYGSFPTWFDIPKVDRDAAAQQIQTGGAPGVPRVHGTWKADDNVDLGSAMAKDWPGRPLYNQAYVTAYFASRQWLQWMRIVLGDDALWRRAQRIAATTGLSHDLTGMHDISTQAGRWQGSGGPCVPSLTISAGFTCGGLRGDGGNLVALRHAVNSYFQDSAVPFVGTGPTPLRTAFEHWMPSFRADLVAGVNQPTLRAVPSSRPMQAQTQFTRVAITSIHGIDLGDPGPEQADMYANAQIGGQPFTSEIINGHDDFTFPRPYYPFTWLKANPVNGRYSPPITSMTITVHTADSAFAGTDDDVYLRLSPTLRFQLDKSLYDDFERGDTDTYSVPIDTATQNGLSIGDITEVRIEKSPDGIAGGWRLGGIRLTVNGSTFYENGHINRWLKGDHRAWTAPQITRDHRTAPALGVWLRLRESDLLSADDDGDINPYDHRQSQTIAYTPGTDVQGTGRGGHADAGRIANDDGDLAQISWHITTIRPVPPPLVVVAPVPPPVYTGPVKPPPPPPKPDLILTNVDDQGFTVKNQGAADAGSFSVAVTRKGVTQTVVVESLAAGASATETFSTRFSCGGGEQGTADSTHVIDETDETNNSFTAPAILC